MTSVMLIRSVWMVFGYLFVNEIYNDIHDIVVAECVDNCGVMLVQFHLDLQVGNEVLVERDRMMSTCRNFLVNETKNELNDLKCISANSQ